MNAARLRPAVFLDRDGTVIREREYLADPAGVELLPGAGSALRRMAEAGYALVLITNQSGIARGFLSEADYQAVQARLEELLRAEGVRLDGVWHCPHHPDFTGPCPCRKPAPGLFQQAIDSLGLDPVRSLFVGDRIADVSPAFRLGGHPLLVRTGYGASTNPPRGVTAVNDLAEAADFVRKPPPATPSKG